MKRWALFAVVVATAALTVMTGMTPVGAAGSGDIIPWSLQAENPNSNKVEVSATLAPFDAQNFNVIIAHDIAYGCPSTAPKPCTSRVPAMKAKNSKLKILLYMNATFAQADLNQGPGQTNGFPTSWYELDSKGNYIQSMALHNYLMLPTNPLWIQNRITTCETQAKAAGYDGCYLDLLGLAPLATGYLSGVPINPTTKLPWTPPAWLAATANLAKSVHTALGSSSPHLLLYGNGLTDGPHYYTLKTSVIVGSVDGGIAEGWMRQASVPATSYPTAVAWKQNVDMIAAVEKAGKPLLTLTKLWATSTSAQQTAWLQFSLASFLLGTGGRSMFFFSPSSSVSRTQTFSLYSTTLGTPSGAYAAGPSGTYVRGFSAGYVAVNPGTATVSVTLPGSKGYFTTVGCPVATPHTNVKTLSLPKDTACILTAT